MTDDYKRLGTTFSARRPYGSVVAMQPLGSQGMGRKPARIVKWLAELAE